MPLKQSRYLFTFSFEELDLGHISVQAEQVENFVRVDTVNIQLIYHEYRAPTRGPGCRRGHRGVVGHQGGPSEPTGSRGGGAPALHATWLANESEAEWNQLVDKYNSFTIAWLFITRNFKLLKGNENNLPLF